MSKKESFLVFLLLVPFFLAGCATGQKNLEIQDWQERISFLENQVKQRDSRISELTDASLRVRREKQELLNIIEQQDKVIDELTRDLQDTKRARLVFPKSRSKEYYSFVIRIQTALKNSGMDLGLIDGRMGNRTRQAVQKFQKQNSLPVNGQVNKQTWNLLRQFLQQ